MTGNGVVLSEIRQTEPAASPVYSPMPTGYLFHAGLVLMQVEARRSAASNSNLGHSCSTVWKKRPKN
jgi:hypothetical protein